MSTHKVYMEGSTQTMHGHLGKAEWQSPLLVAASDEASRPNHGNHIKANEYMDDRYVLEQKVDLIVELIKQAKCCTAYTGAGLSRAAGIADYATRAKNSVTATGVPKLRSNLDAQPTVSHKILTAMEKEGYLHHYVQQNHDGLPQKAGYPQSKLNEIHGAWFDPSNPVVKFSGNLRDDLFNWMYDMEAKIDLCLCLGTSLSGMNADRVAKTPAKRMIRGDAGILGTVIINLQQTPLDKKSAVRVWAKLDDVFSMIASKLALDMTKDYAPKLSSRMKNKYEVPYNRNGVLDTTSKMILNMNSGEEIRICVPGASNEDCRGVVKRKDAVGNYVVVIDEEGETKHRVFGRWFVLEAMEGKLPMLPLVNTNPHIINS